MSDEYIRRLYRDGDLTQWHAALLRAGQLTIYDKPIGPLSILEQKCAEEDCDDTLAWSNCSYCHTCHDRNCDYERGMFRRNSYVNTVGQLDSNTDASCNNKEGDTHDLV